MQSTLVICIASWCLRIAFLWATLIFLIGLYVYICVFFRRSLVSYLFLQFCQSYILGCGYNWEGPTSLKWCFMICSLLLMYGGHWADRKNAIFRTLLQTWPLYAPKLWRTIVQQKVGLIFFLTSKSRFKYFISKIDLFYKYVVRKDMYLLIFNYFKSK